MRNLPLQPILALILAMPLGLSTVAEGSQMPDAFRGRPVLEVATGAPQREQLRTSSVAPKQAAKAWAHFRHGAGGQWQALWDAQTNVPLRIYGTGMSAPGSISDPARASRHAGDLLRQHIQLLAPGNQATDFKEVSNEVHRGIRTVGYQQIYSGMPVVGGQVSFRFKADRMVVMGSEALPSAKSSTQGRLASTASLQQSAKSWVLQDSATTAQAKGVLGPMVLPLVSGQQTRYHTVMAVTVEGQAPLGKWRVYLDAQTAKPVAREQTLRFAEGTVRYDVPLRSPGGDREYIPAPVASLTVDGVMQESGPEGQVSWDGNGAAMIRVQTRGPLVDVNTQSGPAAFAEIQILADGNLDWSEAGDQLLDAQLSAFVHAYIAKEKVREMNPSLGWLDTELPVNVNIDDACNAFSDGNSINFFVQSTQCANTARLADVVYHEFGHSMHAHSIIEGVGAFDGAFSEGLSDYLAATITGDPAMGVGFFKSSAPLRHIDPSNREHVWPDDVEEIHYTGLIFAGAMWDLRKLMIEQYGQENGATLTDTFFYGAVQRASNIPATYVEVLLEDDDDGDLENGTPNLCDINAAFGAHGLRSIQADAGNLSVVGPELDNYGVTMSLQGLTAECPGDSVVSAEIDWQLRNDEVEGVVQMTESDGLFAGDIPKAVDGSVVRYQINVEFADGTKKTFPENPADSRYEFYVGEIVELYCTDFESDPFAAGWTHGLTAGEPEDGADDWAWGPSLGGASSGDAPSAFSGDNVVGNDLGGDDYDGRYQSNKTNFLSSPVIEVGNYSDVRLQYRRWLNVEDGFFDKGKIYSNDQLVWTNFNSMSETSSTIHHQDREWRFHDVGLVGSTQTGLVQIKFELETDAGLQLGGWTIDDFCVVANANAICGDETLYGPEECDEGTQNSNTEPNACRESCLAPSCGDGVVDTGESCDDGNNQDGDGCESNCLFDGQAEGDCGCQVGGNRPWPAGTALLALFGFVGMVALRRRWGAN